MKRKKLPLSVFFSLALASCTWPCSSLFAKRGFQLAEIFGAVFERPDFADYELPLLHSQGSQFEIEAAF